MPADVDDADPPFRILPKLNDRNRDFWTGGARGRAAVLALPGLRLLHPSAAADLPDRATRRT